MPAIFNPARARGRTAVPPAAPSPTTATSTGFRLVAIMIVAPGGAMIRLDGGTHLLHVGTGGEAWPRITDQIPSSEVLVAAIVRVSEHAFQHEPPRPVEEGSRVLRRFSGIDIGQDLI